MSVAVQALNNEGLPFISVLSDPTYGGVSASYAMQADVRIAVATEDKGVVNEARIGFAGPTVILNTMCEANQTIFDQQCPSDFQAASFVLNGGQVDMVLNATSATQSTQEVIESMVAKLSYLFCRNRSRALDKALPVDILTPGNEGTDAPADEAKAAEKFNYVRSRAMDRPQTQDLIKNVFESFIQLR